MKTKKSKIKATLPVRRGTGMSYERFCEIWKEVFPNGIPKPKGKNVIIDKGCPRANAELIKFGKGLASAFDKFSTRVPKSKRTTVQKEHRRLLKENAKDV